MKDFHRGSFEGRVLGDDTFIEQALLKADEKRHAVLTLDEIINAVCATYQLSTAELRASGKAQPAAEARAVAAHLVRNAASLSLSEPARFLNRDLSGLSQAALRIERPTGTDDLLRKKLEGVI